MGPHLSHHATAFRVKTSICRPSPEAAACTSSTVDSVVVLLLGLTRTATRAGRGTISRSSPSRFAGSSAMKIFTAPFLGFLGDQVAELGRRSRQRRAAEVSETGLHLSPDAQAR
jgi:hypothetical protein